MSKHRDNSARNTEPPQIFVATDHDDQAVVVEADDELVHLSLSPAAAAVLAAVLVRYGSAVRRGDVTSTPADYNDELWHDVGLSTQSASARAFSGSRSRYVAPRKPDAIGRRRRTDAAPLTVVRAEQ